MINANWKSIVAINANYMQMPIMHANLKSILAIDALSPELYANANYTGVKNHLN